MGLADNCEGCVFEMGKRLLIKQMIELGYMSPKKSLPICKTCGGDMEMWVCDVFVCERCEELKKGMNKEIDDETDFERDEI